jgi:hypothetical protein
MIVQACVLPPGRAIEDAIPRQTSLSEQPDEILREVNSVGTTQYLDPLGKAVFNSVAASLQGYTTRTDPTAFVPGAVSL